MFNGTLLIKVSIDDTDACLFSTERAEEKKEQMQIVEERK